MPFAFNGIGGKYYGHRDRWPDGSYIATEWFVILWIPIFPIRSYRLKEGDTKLIFLPYGSKISYSAIPVPLNKKQVIKTYIIAAVIVALLACFFIWAYR